EQALEELARRDGVTPLAEEVHSPGRDDGVSEAGERLEVDAGDRGTDRTRLRHCQHLHDLVGGVGGGDLTPDVALPARLDIASALVGDRRTKRREAVVA